jgi:hypothetical protein
MTPIVGAIQTFEGTGLVKNPTAELDTDGTVRLVTPSQWYHGGDLKGYIKFLKGIRKQQKAFLATL